ncbi:MAG TPA: winged helix-turn-helix transcriptional regulator [Thermoplasmata archaeon]|nr:winged helix-turn-helix transcriptional regulator [Thermoplasmata archaeon]
MELGHSGTTDRGLSSAKRTLLTLLKRSPGASLKEIAALVGISRAGALKHLTKLEEEGLVERQYRAGRRGRPRVCFRLTPPAQRIFPAAYTETALCAMTFIEKHQGRPAVVQMLEERASELRGKHAPRLAGKELSDRVRELGRIRDEEGYMAEVERPRKSGTVLLEHNCPILAIAEKYGEACDVERRLFRDLLGAEVFVSHRVVAGDPVCRFLVRERPRPR